LKMPTRPWYPPMEPLKDIFGLHHVTILGAVCESAVERQRRVTRVKAGVLEAFRAASHHLGEEVARELFKQVLRRPKRGVGKSIAADRDAILLAAFDAAPGESIASIARKLHAKRQRLGNTPAAIAAQIRKLVQERNEREYRRRVEARRWRMATRNEPPSLISSAVAARKK
jgi:hypothetical protein